METSERTRRKIGEASKLDREACKLIAANEYEKEQIISGKQNRGSNVVTAADIEKARAEDQR